MLPVNAPPRTMSDVKAQLRGAAARQAIMNMVDSLAPFGVAPSMREVAAALNLALASVRYHVKLLRADGVLESSGLLRRPPAAP